MKRRIRILGFGLAALASASFSIAVAQTIPELFGKVKAEVKAASWADALKTLDALEAEAGKPGNESAQKQLAGPLAFYRGVCKANLDQKDEAAASFSTFLKLQPNATIDSAIYSKKSVAAFEKAQKDLASRAPSLAEAYKEFQPAADAKETDPADQYWGDGPARWILTDSEKSSWTGLSDPNARVAFVEEFWTARAAIPGSDGRTYRQEFERRVAFADANLAVEAEKRGSLTDRGMVFILLGPPTYAGRKPLRTGDDAGDSAGLSTQTDHDVANTNAQTWEKARASGGRAPSSAQIVTNNAARHSSPSIKAAASGEDRIEVWHYRKELLPKKVPYHQVDFQFLTKKGYGANVLQRSPESANALGAAVPLPAAATAANQR